MKRFAIGLLTVVSAHSAHAQIIPRGVAGSGLAYTAQLAIRYQGEIHRQTGTLLGGQGSVQLGPVVVAIAGFTGTMRPATTSATNADRTIYATDLAIYVRPDPLVALGPMVAGRRYETAVGTAWVRLIGASANVSLPLGPAGLTANALFDYLPVTSASGSDTASLALRGSFGLAYSPPGVPVVLQMAYRLERYDFKAVGLTPARLEQLDGIVIGAGLRLGK